MNSTQTGNGGDSGADLGTHGGAGEAREKLMSDMKNVIHDAEDWLSKTGARSGEEINAVRERFESTLQTAKSDLMKLEANMIAKTKLAAQATDTYVKDNPWKSVGLGAAVGIVFGLLVARR
jgi:ElaB/YqjD/DUF883 family membrane-anchored ribosome-binding protein